MSARHPAPIAAAALLPMLMLSCTRPTPPSANVAPTATADARIESDRLDVSRASARPATAGDAAYFTGEASVTPLFSPTPHTRAAGASAPC